MKSLSYSSAVLTISENTSYVVLEDTMLEGGRLAPPWGIKVSLIL